MDTLLCLFIFAFLRKHILFTIQFELEHMTAALLILLRVVSLIFLECRVVYFRLLHKHKLKKGCDNLKFIPRIGSERWQRWPVDIHGINNANIFKI